MHWKRLAEKKLIVIISKWDILLCVFRIFYNKLCNFTVKKKKSSLIFKTLMIVKSSSQTISSYLMILNDGLGCLNSSVSSSSLLPSLCPVVWSKTSSHWSFWYYRVHALRELFLRFWENWKSCWKTSFNEFFEDQFYSHCILVLGL